MGKYIWAEEYRPTNIKELILPKHLKTVFTACIDKKEFNHLLLSGNPGMGKTSLAKLLCEQTDYNYIIINGANEGRSIDMIRNSVVPYASTVSMFGKRKAIIVDEADNMPVHVQKALLNIIEEYKTLRFIFTCNNPNNIIQPIHSRCATSDFAIPKDEIMDLQIQTTAVMLDILHKENIVVNDQLAIAKIVKSKYPDIRSILMTIESLASTGAIDINNEATFRAGAENPIPELIPLIKNKDFRNILKWIESAIAYEVNINTFCIKIHKELQSQLTTDSIANAILILSEYLSKLDIATDPDIHFSAYIITLSLEMEWEK